MRCCGQQQQVVGAVAHFAGRTQVLRCGRQPMRLVEHGERPRRPGAGDLTAHIRVVCVHVDAHHPDRHARVEVPRVAGHLRGDLSGVDGEVAAKVALPLLDQVSRHNDHGAARDETAACALGDEHAGHDRLARPGFIGEEKAEPRLGQHVGEDRLVLMGVRPQRPGGEHGGTDSRHCVLHPAAPHRGERARRISAGVVGRYGRTSEVCPRQRSIGERPVAPTDDEVRAVCCWRGGDHSRDLTVEPDLAPRRRQHTDVACRHSPCSSRRFIVPMIWRGTGAGTTCRCTNTTPRPVPPSGPHPPPTVA